MKFLVMHTRTVGVSWPEGSHTLWESTGKWLSSLAEAGKVESSYWVPGHGAMAILNVNSHEELSEILQLNPMKPQGHYTVYPLSDINQFMGQMRESSRQATKK